MKKILLTLTVVIAGYCSYAQSPVYTTAGYGANYSVDGTYLGWNISGGGGETNFVNNIGGGNIGGFTFDVTTRSNITTRLMTIANSGNVGLGTTSPGYKLEVNGTFGIRGQMGNGSTGQLCEIIPYEIATDNNAGWAGTMIGVRSGGMNNSSVPLTQNITANALQYQQAWAMTFGTDKYQVNGSAFSVWTGDATVAGTPMSEIFRIKSNGNVGIGTTTPDQLLSVNGTIHSKEVLVNTTGFPDYVFKPAYHLPTLTEVKTYIDKNHHLPDMPTEAEVVKNGLKVGETETLLTKKVEELTLYLIEKDKQVNTLQDEVQQLKQQVNLLIKNVKQ